jgi:hypothetical protein
MLLNGVNGLACVLTNKIGGKSLDKKISILEQQVYDYIKERGELIISDVPVNMRGAISSLKNVGLLETFKKPATQWASKKKTFVKALTIE